MHLKDILSQKGEKVWTAKTTDHLDQVVETLVANKIGALLVFDEKNKVVGIISERDVMRECQKSPQGWAEVEVSKVMTQTVVMVTPEDALDYALGIMTQNRIRHLPVMKDGALAGIVSIGDVVKAQLKDFQHEVQYLKDYIQGT